MQARRIIGIGFGLAFTALLVALYRPFFAPGPAPADSGFNLANLVREAGDDAFDAIEHPWNFRFPSDHGKHARQRTETWQLSGVLEAADGRRLGLQLAVARIALAATPPESDSGWDSGEIYAGLLVLSDPGGAGLLTFERLGRGGLGLADWRADPLRLWIEDWSISQTGTREQAPDLRIALGAENFELSLQLLNQLALINANDVSSTAGEGGPPFVYYVQPRLSASGKLRHQTNRFQVSGTLSIEHAWGELPLPGGPVARDRFSFYLDDGSVLLLVRTHRIDGSGRSSNFGIMARADGTATALGDEALLLEPLANAADAAGFPERWKLRIPDEAIDLEFAIEGEAGTNDSRASHRYGALRLEPGPGLAGGTGFAQLEGYRQ